MLSIEKNHQQQRQECSVRVCNHRATEGAPEPRNAPEPFNVGAAPTRTPATIMAELWRHSFHLTPGALYVLMNAPEVTSYVIVDIIIYVIVDIIL